MRDGLIPSRTRLSTRCTDVCDDESQALHPCSSVSPTERITPPLAYNEEGSAYNGSMFHVGERLLREAIKASFALPGYVELWEDSRFRGLSKLLEGAEARAEVLHALAGYVKLRGDG